MTQNEEERKSKYTPQSYMGEKPYNDIPCEFDEVLAPFVVFDNDMIKTMGINRNNMKTIRLKNGRTVPVAYTPCKIESFEQVLSIYYKDINAYLNRHDRGKLDVVSFDELSLKSVIHRIKFEKDPTDEIKEVVNLEQITYKPIATPSHEEKLMLLITLEELIELVYKCNEKYGKILKMIYQDVSITKQEIIEKLGMKKTQGYDAIKKAQALAKEVYKELNQ
ncbi:TPA: hypothetical protein ACGMC1_001089 [Streptococcus agalactiae]|jgi:hypothetical protein